MEKPERLAGGHRLSRRLWCFCNCARGARALKPEDKAVIGNATSCLEVSTFLYPYTAYQDSYIHSAFENAAATMGGVDRL